MQIQICGLSFKLSKVSRELLAKLQTRVDLFNQGEVQLVSEISVFQQTSTTDLSLQFMRQGATIAARRVAHLQEEIAIRSLLDQFYGLAVNDRQAAIEEASLNLSRAEKDVRGKLIGIGYVDVDPTLGVQGTITPGIIAMHPALAAARAAKEQAKGDSIADHVRLNEERFSVANAELERLRAAALNPLMMKC
jgi:hypothetical protein